MPAAFHELLESPFKAIGGGDLTVIILAALFVTSAIQRCNDIFCKSGRAIEDRVEQIGGNLLATGEALVMPLGIKQFVHNETDVT